MFLKNPKVVTTDSTIAKLHVVATLNLLSSIILRTT